MDQGWTQPAAPAPDTGSTGLDGFGWRFRPLVGLLGIIWLLNAAFQFSGWIWLPTQQSKGGLAPLLAKAVSDSPDWLRPLVQHIATGIDNVGVTIIAGAMVAVALLLGASLIFRAGLRGACGLGIAYSIFCWIALCALGAPYGHGQTDPGVFPAYMIAFIFVLSVAPLIAPRRATIALQPSSAVWTTARILFGLLWLFDAILKWEPYFLTHFMDQLTPAVQGQPHWIAVYINFVIQAVQAIGPEVVAIAVAVVETGIALSLLTGWLMPLVMPLGFLYSLAVWTTAEGWGGPYTEAGTAIRGDVVGNALIYAVIFLFLIVESNRRMRLPPDDVVVA
jgi:hypothetical protein